MTEFKLTEKAGLILTDYLLNILTLKLQLLKTELSSINKKPGALHWDSRKAIMRARFHTPELHLMKIQIH